MPEAEGLPAGEREPPAGGRSRGWAPALRGALGAAWAVLPARAFAIALAATLLVWGRYLLPDLTLSPAAQVPTVDPLCRVGTAQLSCQVPYIPPRAVDAGAPAWQEVPADYFYRRARTQGEPRPHWNPYVGSGYPIALDGINARTSPTRWFLSWAPGDYGRDVVAFARFLLWTFGLVWAVGLSGAGAPLMAAMALVATLAPYAASYVDIVFLDVDLLGPWFLLILVAFVAGRLSLRAAVGSALGLGVVASAMGFLQSQIAFCVAVGLLAVAAGPSTRWRSIWLGGAVAVAELLFMPAWLPLLRNLDQFISSRDVLCIIEMRQGLPAFWKGLVAPPPAFAGATVTLAGAALMVFAPRRWWFVVAALAAGVAWVVVGLPSAACALPLVSGARLVRHLVPHVEMLFLFAVAVSVHALSERIDGKPAWAAFAAAAVLSLSIAASAFRGGDAGVAGLGAVLGILAAYLGRRGAPAAARRGAFGAGLFLVAVASYPYSSPALHLLSKGWGRGGAAKLEALPVELDHSTALGAVQDLARREDRRHFSPAGFLYPNWSAALGIPDILFLGALYPSGYHELNAALFQGWERDPQHGLVPDRFVPPPPWATLTIDFQRVMAVQRVSLLTFVYGQAFFPGGPSPYQASRCRLVARSPAQGAESWICPDVGGIGYFPEVVRIVRSRAEAIDILRAASPADIARLAVLGPELASPAAGGEGESVRPGIGRVLSVDRRGDDLVYHLDVERPGVFAVADTYFRGWRAMVNGAPVGISRANVAFKAVSVPRGRVELELHFAPGS